MLAMANRCQRSTLLPPATSSRGAPSPAPASGRQAVVAGQSSVGSTRTGTVVCGLIGKFECTSTDGTADVKVTANSCRDGDSGLIAPEHGCPVGRGAHHGGVSTVDGFRVSLSGRNRNECTDNAHTADRGSGGTGGRAVVERSGDMPEMDASVHSARKRQRKTVVYSRLCLDDAFMFDGGNVLLPADLRKTKINPDGGRVDDGGTMVDDDVRRKVFGSGAPTTEVIRFPCVERLIELYANIIRQKEAEVQRFMSSIVRGGGDGDKSRLDKTELKWIGGRECTSGGGELQHGDNRKQGTVPATKRKTLPLGTGLTSDTGHVSPVLPIEEVERTENLSPDAQSDEGWRSSTQQSPYGSSDEEDRLQTRAEQQEQGISAVKNDQNQLPEDQESTSNTMKTRDKVTRSASSDSALGLDEDLNQQEQQQMIASVGKVRRLTLGVSDIPLRSALLPVPEPTTLPSLTTPTAGSEHCPTVVRSKMILEAQVIELPGDGATEQHQQLGCPPSTSVSRRESAQSYISETGDGVRYVRTPSVVVSDYSDDTMCGITLEEIEYFRRHRLRRGSADCESDISAASSCSNLNYCGSSISALDGCEYQCGLRTPERKVSDCSTCSTVSCDEDEGYSVVRTKLANLALPAVGTATVPTPVERSNVPEQKPAPSSEDADVRICSKKKVSHTNTNVLEVASQKRLA